MEEEVLRPREAVITRRTQSLKRRENAVSTIIFCNNLCGTRARANVINKTLWERRNVRPDGVFVWSSISAKLRGLYFHSCD